MRTTGDDRRAHQVLPLDVLVTNANYSLVNTPVRITRTLLRATINVQHRRMCVHRTRTTRRRNRHQRPNGRLRHRLPPAIPTAKGRLPRPPLIANLFHKEDHLIATVRPVKGPANRRHQVDLRVTTRPVRHDNYHRPTSLLPIPSIANRIANLHPNTINVHRTSARHTRQLITNNRETNLANSQRTSISAASIARAPNRLPYRLLTCRSVNNSNVTKRLGRIFFANTKVKRRANASGNQTAKSNHRHYHCRTANAKLNNDRHLTILARRDRRANDRTFSNTKVSVNPRRHHRLVDNLREGLRPRAAIHMFFHQ